MAPQVALRLKNLPASAGDTGDPGSIPGSGRSSGGGHATHPSVLAWKIPWTEQPGGLQSMLSQRAGHDWATEQQGRGSKRKCQYCHSALTEWSCSDAGVVLPYLFILSQRNWDLTFSCVLTGFFYAANAFGIFKTPWGKSKHISKLDMTHNVNLQPMLWCAQRGEKFQK